MKVIYVAGPFRSANSDGTQNAWGIQLNIMAAMALALEVWRLGHAAICPHANTMFYQGAAADHLWLDGDLEILRRCDAVLVTTDWKRSSGARAEVEQARQAGQPVFSSLEELRDWLSRAV
jgi:hypothetical protein